MDVSEQTEVQRTETEVSPSNPPVEMPEPLATSEPVIQEPVIPERVANPPVTLETSRTWLRLAYAFEFWIALISIFIVWSQVGGQAHLDLMAWYFKLSLAVGLALCAVKMTSAMVEKPRAWNAVTLFWFVAILVISTLMFCVTYWYHLHEAQEDQNTDQDSATTVSNRVVNRNVVRIVLTHDRKKC